MQKSKTLTLLIRVAQWLLGLLFIFSGLMKGIDPMGTAIKIGEYAASFGIPLGEGISLVLAVVLNVFEALLGVTLLSGMWRRVSTLVLLIFMIPMTALTLYIAVANPVADCGCFGDALVISNSATFWKNVVILLLAVLLFLFPTRLWRLAPESMSPTILGVAALLLVYFNVYPLRHLPVVDFRPYQVGSDLYTLTQSGTDGEYDYRFVYEREGVEQTFDLNEIAELDSTWTYLRDATVVLREPEEPLGVDLVLLDQSGTPRTPELATPSGQALLYITSDLARLSKKDLATGLRLQEETGEPVTLVMPHAFDELASSQLGEAAVGFSDILFLDRSTASTVIRSNPGLMVIDGGKIVRKSSAPDLRELLKKASFRADPYTPQTANDLRHRRALTFGPLIAGLLMLLIMGIYYRKEPQQTETISTNNN